MFFTIIDAMRIALSSIFVFILTISLDASPRVDKEIAPWKWQMGLMAGLNTSQLSITGGYGASVTTGVQWSAGFGMYCKSSEVNMFRLEAQLAFEATGSGKETYYSVDQYDWVRVYDRYRTIPISVLLLRNLGWKESWSIGLGFKSSFVVGHYVRHERETPSSMSGIIYSPDVRKWIGSPVIQLSHNFPYADVSLSGWYAITPLIDQYTVKAVPYGISFAVKVPLFTREK